MTKQFVDKRGDSPKRQPWGILQKGNHQKKNFILNKHKKISLNIWKDTTKLNTNLNTISVTMFI